MIGSRKILLLFVTCCSFYFCFSQSQKIDSLTRVLPFLHDAGRINCLNLIGETYLGLPDWFTPSSPTKSQFDSARIFVQRAILEANGLNYAYGQAKGSSLLSQVVFESDDNYPEAEKLSRQALGYYNKAGAREGLNRAYWNLGRTFQAQSEFDAATNAYDLCYKLSKEVGDSLYILYSIITTVHTSLDWGRYNKAVDKIQDLQEMISRNEDSSLRGWQLILIGDLYSNFGDAATATRYYDSAKRILPSLFTEVMDTVNLRALRFYLAGTGTALFGRNQYSEALPYLARSLRLNRKANDVNQVMDLLITMSQLYSRIHRTDTALKIAREALFMATKTGARQKIRDACKVLSLIYDDARHADSAFFYYKRYSAMNDSISGEQVKAKLDAFSFNQRIQSLDKEKKIQHMKLQRQSLLKNLLIGGIIFLLLFGAIVVRNIILKRRNEKLRLQHELALQKFQSEQQLSELEMQALRAQMNPHFIFNSLNSINRFILQNDRAQASEYLTKFSRLVRMILQNSQASLISLESELESLKLYLEMESLRFNHHFEYKISFPKDLDIEVLKVPPLIIQPYVENAIWHGLMHKDEKGHLDVDVGQENDYLRVRILDDGIGRQRAAELSSKSATKHKSMGLRITAERIAMMQNANGSQSLVTINDLMNADGTAAGTEVTIKIPVIYD